MYFLCFLVFPVSLKTYICFHRDPLSTTHNAAEKLSDCKTYALENNNKKKFRGDVLYERTHGIFYYDYNVQVNSKCAQLVKQDGSPVRPRNT